jgi:polyferredoxin
MTAKRRLRQGCIRPWFQAAFFALTNGYTRGFLHGDIYKGTTKSVCVPGLNCYSCPGARFACPIGSLQAVLGSRSFYISCYVFGLLMAFGTMMGRWVCGWLCPFGLVQDLLYKVPFFHKEKNMPGHRYLNLLRYVMLLIFVLLLPELAVNAAGMGKPWFCEYICPSGTLLGGIPLVLANAGLRSAAARRFLWKVMLLALILGLSMRYYRPFCKYLCPLGAFYGFFNPIAMYRYRIDPDRCTGCDACSKVCRMGVYVRRNPNSMQCIRCGTCKQACPHQAIVSSFGISTGKSTENTTRNTIRHPAYHIAWKQCLLLAAAIALILVGIHFGEVRVVFAKATNICMECIGIG